MKTSDNVASIKEYYGKFFSLYNATNYVSALKEMRTFIEGISKYGITEISCQCYKKNKLLIDTELFLVYKYNYYIVSAIDISRKSKPLTVRKIEQNSISEGQQINDISYDDDKYGNVKVKGGNCYKFQSSGLPSIFYNLIALQTKQLNKAQQNQILTKIKGLIDKYKLCNTYAHDGDHTSAEVDAKCVYDSIKGEINGIISALKLYYPLENTIKLLESLFSDSQKEIKNGSKKDIAVSQKQRVEVKRHEVKSQETSTTTPFKPSGKTRPTITPASGATGNNKIVTPKLPQFFGINIYDSLAQSQTKEKKDKNARQLTAWEKRFIKEAEENTEYLNKFGNCYNREELEWYIALPLTLLMILLCMGIMWLCEWW